MRKTPSETLIASHSLFARVIKCAGDVFSPLPPEKEASPLLFRPLIAPETGLTHYLPRKRGNHSVFAPYLEMTIGFSNIVHEWSFFNVGVEEFLVHILTPFLIALLMISSPEKEVMNDFFYRKHQAQESCWRL